MESIFSKKLWAPCILTLPATVFSAGSLIKWTGFYIGLSEREEGKV